MSNIQLIEGLSYYVIFLFSTTLHEAAHAWAAKRGGDLTAYHAGQVSIDPIAHIKREPIGMVVLPLISVLVTGWPLGFASAPYDPEWALRHPNRAALMALAGPGANLLILLVAGALLSAGVAFGVFYAPESIRFGHVAAAHAESFWPAAAFLLGALFSLNLALFIFNMLPLPPLDGSAAVPLLLKAERASAYNHFIFSNPTLAWIGLFVAWKIFNPLFHPIFLGAASLLYAGVTYR